MLSARMEPISSYSATEVPQHFEPVEAEVSVPQSDSVGEQRSGACKPAVHCCIYLECGI